MDCCCICCRCKAIVFNNGASVALAGYVCHMKLPYLVVLLCTGICSMQQGLWLEPLQLGWFFHYTYPFSSLVMSVKPTTGSIAVSSSFTGKCFWFKGHTMICIPRFSKWVVFPVWQLLCTVCVFTVCNPMPNTHRCLASNNTFEGCEVRLYTHCNGSVSEISQGT